MYDYVTFIRLDLKNCSFAVTRPTQLWRCQLKIFYWTPMSKKIFWVKKTFPEVTDYFNVKFNFPNTCLNSVEHIYYFPQQKIERTDVWFLVSKAFCFLFKPCNETFWNVIISRHLKTKKFMNIFLWICFKLCLFF